MKNKPYTYLIGWTFLDKWYYGVRWANKKPPHNDLWHEYYTSSKVVKETIDQYGDPDLVRVDQIFDTVEDAIKAEDNYLREIHKNNKWSSYLNQRFGNAFILTPEMIKKANKKRLQYRWTEERSKHMQKIMTGREISQEWRDKISKSLTGKPLSDDRKKKISQSRTGQKVSNETKQKISNTLKGRKFSNEHRQLLRENNHRTDNTVRKFVNNNKEFIGTAKEFSEKYTLCRSAISHLISGRQKTTKGWVYVGEA